MPEKNIVHVAVAVLQNSNGQYLIAKRPQESHQGGLWEFPGGKVENNESVLDALKRELFEETGITIIQATPLIRIYHDYSDKSVLLDVWHINNFSGEAFGKEEQKIRWISTNDFSFYDFPEANMPIIKAVQLPDKYMITGNFNNEDDLLKRIQDALKKGIKLVQFRAKNIDTELYFCYAKKIYQLCEKSTAKVLLNISVKNYIKYHADKYSHGIHLNTKEIKSYNYGILNHKCLVSTSTHNEKEINLSKKKQIDFIVLSPVKNTLSHPSAVPLGWKQFQQLADKAACPVYALGGMTTNDIDTAKKYGAQGIAAISEFWNS